MPPYGGEQRWSPSKCILEIVAGSWGFWLSEIASRKRGAPSRRLRDLTSYQDRSFNHWTDEHLQNATGSSQCLSPHFCVIVAIVPKSFSERNGFAPTST